jgi:hypothetical protein
MPIFQDSPSNPMGQHPDQTEKNLPRENQPILKPILKQIARKPASIQISEAILPSCGMIVIF